MAKPQNATKVEVKTRSDLREWLQANYQRKNGVWLVTYKKPNKYPFSVTFRDLNSNRRNF